MVEAVEICALIFKKVNALEVIAANIAMTPAAVVVVVVEVDMGVDMEVVAAETCVTISKVEHAPEAATASFP